MTRPTATEIRAEMDRALPGFSALADELKITFGARLTYLHTDRLTLGRDPCRPEPTKAPQP